MAFRRARGLAALLCICIGAPAAGQDGGAPGQASSLADQAQQLRTENPQKAIEAANQALALLKQQPDVVVEVRALNAMAWALMQRGQFEDAVARATESKTRAEAGGDRAGLARAINNLGVIAQRRGDALTAIEQFEASLAIYRELNAQTDIANALNNLGFVHGTDLADYEKSLEYHVEALRVRESLKDANAVALSLNNIGIVYARLKEPQRALQYFERSLELRRANNSVNRSAGTLSNIGDVYLELGDIPKAFDYHHQSLEMRRRIGEKPGVANSLKNLGLVYAAMKKPLESRRHFNEALAASRETRDRTTETQALIGLASLEASLGKPAEAARLASLALDIARAAGSRELERRAWAQLAAAEEAAGRPAAALAAFKSLKSLEDGIFADDKALRIDMLERRYQAEKHQAENERLRAQQQLSALQASRSRLQRNTIAGAAVLMLMIGFVLYRRRVDAARLASELSVTDALTGLRNRRFVQQTIEADVAGAVRRARTDPDGGLVFILLDVDHFKQVNDTHGHKTGDAMLVEMAAVLRACCRASDTIARWGGEEFLVVCRATPPRDGAVLAERIRAAVAGRAFGGGLQATCSLGLAALPFEGRELSWEQAVALADRALYEAKRTGRNRWVDARHLPHDATLPIAQVATAIAEPGRA